MGLLQLIKRKYQWRGEHYLEALAEQDLDKRRAIMSEFIGSLQRHVVLVELVDKSVEELEKILIKNSVRSGEKTIYEIAEQLAEEMKAPVSFKN